MRRPFPALLAIAAIISGTLGRAAAPMACSFARWRPATGVKFVHDNGGRGS